MACPVFRGIGGCAYKYYMIFQHHLAPPVSTFTTAKLSFSPFSLQDDIAKAHKDAPSTMGHQVGGSAPDATQLKDTYVYKEEHEDDSYIIGRKPGVCYVSTADLHLLTFDFSHMLQSTRGVYTRDWVPG